MTHLYFSDDVRVKDGKQQTVAKNTVKALPRANIAVLSYCVVIRVTGESDRFVTT